MSYRKPAYGVDYWTALSQLDAIARWSVYRADEFEGRQRAHWLKLAESLVNTNTELRSWAGLAPLKLSPEQPEMKGKGI